MLNVLAKLLLVATAFAPVLLTYAFVFYLKQGMSQATLFLIGLTIGLVVICVYIMKTAKRQIERVPFPLDSVKTADMEIVGFVIAYLLPLFSADPTAGIDLRVLAFVLIIFFLVVWTTNSYHFNPLLGLLGYHFYEVTTTTNVTFLLITRRDIKNSRSVSRVVQLTDYMVLDPGDG